MIERREDRLRRRHARCSTARSCRHFAFSEDDADWQLWIEDGSEASSRRARGDVQEGRRARRAWSSCSRTGICRRRSRPASSRSRRPPARRRSSGGPRNEEAHGRRRASRRRRFRSCRRPRSAGSPPAATTAASPSDIGRPAATPAPRSPEPPSRARWSERPSLRRTAVYARGPQSASTTPRPVAYAPPVGTVVAVAAARLLEHVGQRRLVHELRGRLVPAVLLRRRAHVPGDDAVGVAPHLALRPRGRAARVAKIPLGPAAERAWAEGRRPRVLAAPAFYFDVLATRSAMSAFIAFSDVS